MIAAYDQTEKAYHEKYGNQFGDKNNSFVCRQDNIDKILKCLFMGHTQDLDSIQLDGSSFDGTQSAPISVLSWFKKRLQEEIHKDWLLDKIVESKKQRVAVAEIKTGSFSFRVGKYHLNVSYAGLIFPKSNFPVIKKAIILKFFELL